MTGKPVESLKDAITALGHLDELLRKLAESPEPAVEVPVEVIRERAGILSNVISFLRGVESRQEVPRG